jgi:hypothetical protein
MNAEATWQGRADELRQRMANVHTAIGRQERGLGTSGLPLEVVRQNCVIGVWMTNDPHNPRAGEHSVGVHLDGREAGEAIRCPDEARYVAAVLLKAAERLLEVYT